MKVKTFINLQHEINISHTEPAEVLLIPSVPVQYAQGLSPAMGELLGSESNFRR